MSGKASLTALALDPPPPAYSIPNATPVSWPTPPVPMRTAGAGVLDDEAGGGEYSQQIRMVNAWWENLPGQRSLVVIAGTAGGEGDVPQGAILVVLQDITTHTKIGDPTIYLAPTNNRYVRVIDAVGERLTLRSEDGTLFYFNLPTRQWVKP